MFPSPYRIDNHGGGYTDYDPMTIEEWAQHAYELMRSIQSLVTTERCEASFLLKSVYGGMEEAVRRLMDEYEDYISPVKNKSEDD